MTMLAPVGISVYTRIHHFKRSVQALQRNELAERTNLVIYSDAASCVEDEPLVSEVREFAHSIQGFRTVTVIERPVNYGGVKNAHEGLKQLIRVFEIAICVEDDIEVAPGFLAFMNQALDFYKDNPAVTSISGYSPPLAISDFVGKDFYTMNRFCGWGCGVYERTMDWLATKISLEEFDEIKDKQVLCEFGEDVLNMVKREVAGEIDAADVRCMFKQAKYETATIYPKYSLVQNNGHDGSGVHCGKSNRFSHEQLWNKTEHFSFDHDTQCDSRIKKEQQDFRTFNGRYVHLRTIFNVKQSKNITSALLANHFDNAFDELLKNKSSEKVVREHSIVLLSSPRVGSTWLCDILSTGFGQCIANEWLHRRFVEKYLQEFKGATALDYLHLLNYYAFPNESVLALHIHINQYQYWLKEYEIDLFEFFSFSQVFYMQRKNTFAQIYSYAIASETGLWGDKLVQKANISEKFLVSINKNKFEQVEESLGKEFAYFNKHLKAHVNTSFYYESILSAPERSINTLFSMGDGGNEYQFSIPQNSKKITKAFIDADAKTQLSEWYHAKKEQYDLLNGKGDD